MVEGPKLRTQVSVFRGFIQGLSRVHSEFIKKILNKGFSASLIDGIDDLSRDVGVVAVEQRDTSRGEFACVAST